MSASPGKGRAGSRARSSTRRRTRLQIDQGPRRRIAEPRGADPARGNRLDAAGDGKAGVERHRVGPSVVGHVAEQQSVALAAAKRQAGAQELRLAPLIIVAEIDERGGDAL